MKPLHPAYLPQAIRIICNNWPQYKHIKAPEHSLAIHQKAMDAKHYALRDKQAYLQSLDKPQGA